MAQGERTEKATPRRLAKARREGNFAVSAVFVSAVQFAVAVAWLTDSGEEALAASRAFLRESIALAFRGPGGSDLVAWAQRLGWRIAAAALGAATALATVALNAVVLSLGGDESVRNLAEVVFLANLPVVVVESVAVGFVVAYLAKAKPEWIGGRAQTVGSGKISSNGISH